MLNQTVVKERGHTSKQTKAQREMTSAISSHATGINHEVKVVLYQIQLQHWLIMRTDIQGCGKPSNNDNSQITVRDIWSNENSTLKSIPFEKKHLNESKHCCWWWTTILLRPWMTDDLIKQFVKCTNAYPQHVINSSHPLTKCRLWNE